MSEEDNQENISSTEMFVPVDLPSKFKPYDQKELFLRPMKTGEVKKIKPTLLSGDPFNILDILKDCSSPIHIQDLTTGDLWYVLAWLRLNTFPSSPLIREWECPECGADNELHYSLKDAGIDYLPDEYREPAYLKLTDGTELPLRFPRASDSKKARKWYMEVYDKDPTPEEIYSVELALTLANTNDLLKRLEIIDNLPPEDYLKVEGFSEYFSHGLRSSEQDTCKECGHVEKHVRFTFQLSDLVPYAESTNGLENAISFGKSNQSGESDG